MQTSAYLENRDLEGECPISLLFPTWTKAAHNSHILAPRSYLGMRFETSATLIPPVELPTVHKCLCFIGRSIICPRAIEELLGGLELPLQLTQGRCSQREAHLDMTA